MRYKPSDKVREKFHFNNKLREKYSEASKEILSFFIVVNNYPLFQF